MRKFGLVGHNISYSHSPAIHAALYAECGIAAEYSLMDIAVADFDKSVSRLLAELDGFNVTQPYKEQIIPHLNNCSLSSVNTVVSADGKGYSTDGIGLVRHLNSLDTHGKNILLLGSGGVAKAIVGELINFGYHVAVSNRTRNTQEFFESVRQTPTQFDKAHIIVNCTSCKDSSMMTLLDGYRLDNIELCYDCQYTPTYFSQWASKLYRTVNGQGMLIYQAIEAFKIMCKINLSEEEIDYLYNVITNILGEKQ